MKYISINGQTIRKNSYTGSADPPIRIAKSPSDSKPQYASEIQIIGNARLIYTPNKRMIKCGARLVLVCDDIKVLK